MQTYTLRCVQLCARSFKVVVFLLDNKSQGDMARPVRANTAVNTLTSRKQQSQQSIPTKQKQLAPVKVRFYEIVTFENFVIRKYFENFVLRNFLSGEK